MKTDRAYSGFVVMAAASYQSKGPKRIAGEEAVDRELF
jgi:hypothetical protein